MRLGIFYAVAAWLLFSTPTNASSPFEGLPKVSTISAHARFLGEDGRAISPRLANFPYDLSILLYRYLLLVVPREVFQDINKGCYNLVEARPGYYKPLPMIGNDDLIKILKNRRLRTLDLSGCVRLRLHRSDVIDSLCQQTALTELYLPRLEKRYSKYTGFSDRGLIEIGEKCRSIRNLNFSSFSNSFGPPKEVEVIGAFPNLTVLTFEGRYKLYVSNLSLILPHLSALVELHLPGCEWIGEGDVAQIAAQCPALKVLNLSKCSRLHSKALRHLHGLRQLTDLDISWLLRSDNNESDLIDLARAELPLKSLNILGMKFQSNEVFAAFNKHCPDLEILKMHKCTPLEKAEHAGWFPQLKVANFDYPENDALGVEFARAHPRLVDLKCFNGSKANFIKMVPFMRGIKFLRLDFIHLADPDVCAAVSQLTNLHSLSAAHLGARAVSNLKQIALSCKRLTNLDLEAPVGMNLAEVLAEFHHLKTLELGSSVVDSVAACIAKGCAGLTELNLSGFSPKDADLAAFRHFTQLRRLSMRACNGLSYDGICKLLKDCPSLTRLHFADAKLTEEQMDEIGCFHPRVQILTGLALEE